VGLDRINFKKANALLLLCLVLFATIGQADQPLDKVSLQLNWKYQFEFAGFIMAKEKGFYEEEGLDVELLEYYGDTQVANTVLDRQANYGLLNSSVAIAEKKILPTVLMATYLQQSPLVIIAQKNIKHPKDLIGKKLMGTEEQLSLSPLALMLDYFSVNKRNTQFVPHSFSIKDFAKHKVDAITAFKTNEVFELDQQGIEYNILDPHDYGFSTTVLNLFTSFPEATNHPERTRKFIAASNKGWAYAIEHPDETIQVIIEKYSSKKSVEALKFEATVIKKLMLLDFFTIGEANKDLSLRLVKQLKYSGLLMESEQLGAFLFKDVVDEFSLNNDFTEEQLQYLHAKKKITMCVNPQWMPFEAIEGAKHIGIAADVIKGFEKLLPVPIVLNVTDSWASSIAKAKTRECDIFSLVAETSERLKYMSFTKPYLTLPVVLATKVTEPFIANLTEIKSRPVGIVKGYAIAEKLRNSMPGINIVDVESISDGLERVRRGELYGYIGNLMAISNSIQKEFTGQLKVSARLKEDISLGLSTRNDEPLLNDIFSILVETVDEESLQPIYNKWVVVQQNETIDYGFIWKLGLAFLLISFLYLYHYLHNRRLKQELIKLSTTDKLTGLDNRLKTDELLLKRQEDLKRYDVDTSIILLDIDFFKKVNDQYGHLAGDGVLVEFSQILTHNVRVTDSVGRWGGEEFLIICPNVDVKAATLLAEKILDKVRAHSFVGVGLITASAGVSGFSKTLSVTDVLGLADKALYQSKVSGRDRVVAT